MPQIAHQEPRGGGERRADDPALFLPTPPAHPHNAQGHRHHSGSVGLLSVNRWQLPLSLHPSGTMQGGDTAQWPLSCPGNPQGGHSLTGEVQARIRLDAVAMPPAPLPYGSPISSRGPALLYGLGIVWDSHMSRQAKFVTHAHPPWVPPCHKKEEAREMRWRNSPCSYFKSAPSATRRAVVQTRILPSLSRAVIQAHFTVTKLKKKKKVS